MPNTDSRQELFSTNRFSQPLRKFLALKNVGLQSPKFAELTLPLLKIG